MRIAIITTHWGPPWKEGVRNLARSLEAFLVQNGDEVNVLHPVQRKNESGSPLSPPSIRCVKDNGLFLVDARRNLARNQYDVAFWFTSLSSWYGAKLRYLQSTSVPIVPFVTGMRSVVRGFDRFAEPTPTLTISPYLRDRYLPDATFVPPFLPVHLQRPESFSRTTPDDPFRLLFLGSFQAERGVECLLDALSRLDDRFRLTIAWNGGGADRAGHIRKRIQHDDIRPRVRLVESVDVADEFQQADVLLIPRLHETRMAFPVRVLEAAHMRLPMVVSDVLGMRSVIGGAGRCARPGDPVELANAIATLLTNPDEYESAVNECAVVEERFDSRTSLQSIREVLEHAAA